MADAAAPRPPVTDRRRDVLWCRAITDTLDTYAVERVLKRFNEIRPDPPDEETLRACAEIVRGVRRG